MYFNIKYSARKLYLPCIHLLSAILVFQRASFITLFTKHISNTGNLLLFKVVLIFSAIIVLNCNLLLSIKRFPMGDPIILEGQEE